MNKLFCSLVLVLVAAVPCFAQGSEEDLLKGLEKAAALMERGKWSAAKDYLLSLLDEHRAGNHLISHRTEIENRIKTCVFRESHEIPDVKTLLSGDLISYSESSGLMKLRYTADRMDDFTGTEKEATKVLAALKFYVHPVVFAGPYTIEIKGDEYPQINSYAGGGLPRIHVCLTGQESIYVIYGSQPVNQGMTRTWYPPRIVHVKDGIQVGEEVKDTSPVSEGKPFKMKVVVGTTKVAAYFNGKLLLQINKPKTLFGQFGFSLIPFEEVYINGKVEPAWLQCVQDAHEQNALAEFDKTYRPEDHFPGWFLEEREADPVQVSDRSFHYLGELLNAKQEENVKAAMVYLISSAYEDGISYIEGLKDKDLPEETREFFIALFLKALGRSDEALEHCRKACAIEPEMIDAKKLELELLFDLEREEEARAACQAFFDSFPGNVEPYRHLADLYFNAGLLDEAEQLVHQAHGRGLTSSDLDQIGFRLLKARQGPWENPSEYQSKNYLIRSDIDKKVCFEASRILEEAYTSYSMNLQKIKDIEENKFQVYLFSGEAGYKAYCRDLLGYDPSGTAGLYLPALKKLLIWNLPDREAMMQTVRHEGLHQYLHRLMRHPPIWFDEGLAEYYEVAEQVRGRWKLGEVHPEDRAVLKRNSGKLTPLSEFLHMNRTVFMRNAGLNYAQSWAFIHFLQNSSRDNKALFECLFTLFQEPIPVQEAIRQVFDGVDLEAMQADFDRHIAAL